jgi:hypothetical protein
VNVELNNLEAGDYVVHVRLDRDHRRKKVRREDRVGFVLTVGQTYFQDSIDKWNVRKLSKIWTEACVSKSIAVSMCDFLIPATGD